jgi:hypothetical protein
LKAPDGEASDFFGHDVATHKDTIVVGDQDKGVASASVQIFVWNTPGGAEGGVQNSVKVFVDDGEATMVVGA